MGDIPGFGKLETVDIRSCWQDEARHFTPWLATAEGLHLLGEALGLELAVESVEVAAGPYSSDILARDLTTDAYVIIENQLEKTNHDHFGKALTYAAILGAKTIVWVAKRFTDEHRKSLEWLNELTKGDLLLYGVEVQVWRIGTSPPAPRFEVVVSPNETVIAATIARDAEISPTRLLQRDFWTFLRERLEATRAFSSLQTPQAQYWYDIALGRSGFTLSLFANTYDRVVGIRVYLAKRVADRAMEQLQAQSEEIERELGFKLEWNPHPEKMDKVVRVGCPGDIAERGRWPELADWRVPKAVALRTTFAPRIAKLNFVASPAALIS